MVSYFLPRGRFLIKSGNLRETYQKPTRWPVRWTFRRSLTTKPQDSKIDPLTQLQQQQKSTIISTTNKENNSPLNSLKRQRTKNPWFSWSGLLLRWAPMGFCVFGAIEWQWHRNKVQKENLPRTASDFQAKVYCSLPLRIISRCWGWLASCYIPTSFRPFIYGWYSNSFGVNLEEARYSDLKHYESLAQFFTRPLKEGARVVDPHCALVSPADGKVLHFGTASQSLIEQVKGINYRIDSFLGPNSWLKDSDNSKVDYEEALRMNKNEPTAIFQCVIYLAPGDYHRFHSPADWEPQIRRHFTGELLSVSPKVATWLPGLFCVNERALYIGKWLHGFFSFTAVGATNVGSVEIYVDEQLKTNRWVGFKVGSHKNTCSEFEELQLPEGTKLGKGELLGQFNMGSTVVLLFEAPRDFKFHIKQGQTIRMGEPLGYVEKQAK